MTADPGNAKDSAEEKRTTMLELMESGIAMLHLDPRRDGVMIPDRFKQDCVVRLSYAYGFNLPALTIDDEGVYAVLSFKGERAGVNVPWGAIFAITSPERENQGRLWPEDVPLEVLASLLGKAAADQPPEQEKEQQPASEAQERPARRPETTRPDRPLPQAWTQQVRDGATVREEVTDPGQDGGGSSRRGHLRVIR